MNDRWVQMMIVSVLVLVSGTSSTWAQIEGSPHDLSAVVGGATCSFCHTPHGALAGTPLWSHKLSTAVYQIYQSSSLEAEVGQPTGSSKLCLSCHDGTVALTESLTSGVTGSTYIAPGSANLGTDLSDDHPISFVYSSTLSARDPYIRPPSTLPEQLKLDRSNELQCTTCHDPHDNRFGDFLVMPNDRSRMCTSCHDLTGWIASSHESSNVPVGAANDPYLQGSPHGTLADAACAACHQPHGAGGSERLLHFARSEDNCLNCHDGSVARTNIRADLAKFSRHDVVQYEGIHDPRETPGAVPTHVECVDCHNPHAVQQSTTQAPLIQAAMQGASGVTTSGAAIQNAQFEYEVCFKCHADSADRVGPVVTRQITQPNVRLAFDPSGPSFHPVTAPGTNQQVPSLKPPMTVATQIYCSDCHSSDSSSLAKGPHGSVYPHLLAYRYEMSDFTQENSTSYELCYQCHSRNSILNDESFPRHKEHLEDGIPCSACHDPHGISASQGTALNNSHLINFDIAIVQPDPNTGRLEFEDLGVFHGQCFLSCHGNRHSPGDY